MSLRCRISRMWRSSTPASNSAKTLHTSTSPRRAWASTTRKSWHRSASTPRNAARSSRATTLVIKPEGISMHIRYACALLASALIFTTSVATAREQKVSRPGDYRGYSSAHYDGHELTSRYVQVRDGTRIAVDIFRPANAGRVAPGRFPIVWMHTPYNRRNTQNGLTAANYPGKALQLVKYGYAVAVADFRGTYASFGKNAGYNRGEWQDAARFDAYDITEWLASRPWSSGKIGMWGCSATGGSQMQSLTNAAPSLKAVVAMSAEWDAYPFGALGGVSRGAVARPNATGDGNAERDAAAVPVDGPDGPARMAQAIAQH